MNTDETSKNIFFVYFKVQKSFEDFVQTFFKISSDGIRALSMML